MKNILLTLSFLFSLNLAFGQELSKLMPESREGYQVGDYIEDFELKNIDESMLSLKGLEDTKGYVIVFSCNHCPYVVASEDRMIEIHNKYAPQGYPMVAINSNDINIVPGDSFEGMQARAKEKSFPFYYLRDESQDIAKKFGAKKTPHVYLVQKEEKGMQVKYIGAIDDSPRDAEEVEEKYLEGALDALLAGEEIDPNFTKALGCTIKWKKETE